MLRSTRPAGALVGLFALVAALPATAEPASPEWAAVDDYRAALESVERGEAAGRVEALFASAERIRTLFLSVPATGPGFMESLSEGEFARLEASLPGLRLNRVELTLVWPDHAFFRDLAERRGDAADRRFFAALADIYRAGSPLPVYLDLVTDYSACTVFGAGHLVGAYRRWSELRRDFAGRYVEAVSRELDLVTEELLADCACGDAASVERELGEFVAAFPDSSIRDRVAQRREAVVDGTARLRTRCRPS